ncbi:NAD(P)H-binding protein [Nocardia sp. NPDC005978]|uniref:SDR family oxidoreductase n=1 Tax=Nocardia sp. NPDC005978 TaxID=3156725 RepID=UPI0033BF7039
MRGIKLVTVGSAGKSAGCSPTGIVGRCLVRELVESGERVRVVAEADQLGDWPAAVEVVEGSIARCEGISGAFDGVDGIFLAGAQAATAGRVLEAARGAGVERIVLLSSHGAEHEAAYPPETWFWLAIERAVESAGMAWTHIRPSAVMGAVLEGTYPATGSDWAESIAAENTVREAFLEMGHYPFIHERDLAAVAATALCRDGYEGMLLEAVGFPLSTRSRLRDIADVLGRDITAVELTPAESRAAWRARGWPEDGIDVTLFALEEYGVHFDELTRWTAGQRPTVPDLIGRPMHTYRDWVAEHAALFGSVPDRARHHRA